MPNKQILNDFDVWCSNISHFISFTESGKELLSVHTSLEIEKPAVRQEMEKIRNELVKHLGIDKSDVQLHGITPGSLTFIFSLPEFDATRLLDVSFLNSMWTHKVLKIETQNFILTPGIFIHFSNFNLYSFVIWCN